MSGPRVTIKYHEKHRYWWASWGGETFYGTGRCMRTWSAPEAARDWVCDNYPNLIVSIERPIQAGLMEV